MKDEIGQWSAWTAFCYEIGFLDLPKLAVMLLSWMGKTEMPVEHSPVFSELFFSKDLVLQF